MVDEIVIIHNGEPRLSSFDIFTDLGYNQHRFLKEIIYKNKTSFEEFGLLPLETSKPKKKQGGRPDVSFLINEDQFILLVLLCKNNPKTVPLKIKIVKQFTAMKNALIEMKEMQSDPDWKQIRNSGKVSRNEETAIIEEFIEYAKTQGSTNYARYYGNFTKMQNASLFVITQKFKNVRDVLDGQQLAVLSTCDQIVLKSIREGMKEDLFYKDIFQLAKKEVLKFVDIIGRTAIPNQKQIK